MRRPPLAACISIACLFASLSGCAGPQSQVAGGASVVPDALVGQYIELDNGYAWYIGPGGITSTIPGNPAMTIAKRADGGVDATYNNSVGTSKTTMSLGTPDASGMISAVESSTVNSIPKNRYFLRDGSARIALAQGRLMNQSGSAAGTGLTVKNRDWAAEAYSPTTGASGDFALHGLVRGQTYSVYAGSDYLGVFTIHDDDQDIGLFTKSSVGYDLHIQMGLANNDSEGSDFLFADRAYETSSLFLKFDARNYGTAVAPDTYSIKVSALTPGLRLFDPSGGNNTAIVGDYALPKFKNGYPSGIANCWKYDFDYHFVLPAIGVACDAPPAGAHYVNHRLSYTLTDTGGRSWEQIFTLRFYGDRRVINENKRWIAGGATHASYGVIRLPTGRVIPMSPRTGFTPVPGYGGALTLVLGGVYSGEECYYSLGIGAEAPDLGAAQYSDMSYGEPGNGSEAGAETCLAGRTLVAGLVQDDFDYYKVDFQLN
jgi:hypothetical protein